MNRDRERPDAPGHDVEEDAVDPRDAALGATLRASAPPPPMQAVDWSALHARITAAAAPELARLASDAAADGGSNADAVVGVRTAARGWWQPLAGWSPRGIPLAAAASVLLMLAAGALRSNSPDPLTTVSFRTVEEELADGLSAGARQLLAEDGSAAVLDVALFSDGEDW